MGDWDVEVGGKKYNCRTRTDRNKVLGALSKAVDGEPSAIMRTGDYGFRSKQNNDGIIIVRTSSERHGEETTRFRKETVKKALEYYTY